jgi:putative ABC transport system ATP-binding protein
MENANVGPVVTAVGLTFAYPNGHTLFSDINVEVAAGSLLCVTGPSGAGKSTLLYCLAGVLRAGGAVMLMGERLPESASQRAAVRLATCGFVFQRGELLPELSIVENVALPLRMIGRSRRDALQAAMSALSQLGVAECANRTPSEVSGGQAQRASVARALIHAPRIVFADEPTASLDSENRDVVIRHLKEAMNDGTTVICATHDPALISIADDVFVMVQR